VLSLKPLVKFVLLRNGRMVGTFDSEYDVKDWIKHNDGVDLFTRDIHWITSSKTWEFERCGIKIIYKIMKTTLLKMEGRKRYGENRK